MPVVDGRVSLRSRRCRPYTRRYAPPWRCWRRGIGRLRHQGSSSSAHTRRAWMGRSSPKPIIARLIAAPVARSHVPRESHFIIVAHLRNEHPKICTGPRTQSHNHIHRHLLVPERPIVICRPWRHCILLVNPVLHGFVTLSVYTQVYSHNIDVVRQAAEVGKLCSKTSQPSLKLAESSFTSRTAAD